MTVSVDQQWTYEKYRELPDDGNRYEVLEGRLYVTPAPTSYHQILSRRLQFLFYELERKGEGVIFDAPIDLLIPGATPVQPDLVYLKPGQESLVTKRGIEGVPELIVEILSPSTAARDRTDKLHVYRKSGVRRYLLVDPAARTLEVLLLDGDAYRIEASLGPDDSLEMPDYGISLVMEDLFKGIPNETMD